jgi:hypothetical protein
MKECVNFPFAVFIRYPKHPNRIMNHYSVNMANGKIMISFIPFTISVTCSEAEPAFAAIYKAFISGFAMYTNVRHMDIIGQVQDQCWASGMPW